MNREEMEKRSRLRELVGVSPPRHPAHSGEEVAGGRRADRAPSDSWAVLSVVAIDLLGRKSPALSADLSPGELNLFFGRRTAPTYRPGEIVHLCMKSPSLGKPLVAAGWVRRIESTDWGRMYAFRFVDWRGVVARIPQDHAGRFSRRSDRRVTHDSNRPIELTIGGLPPVSWEQVFAGSRGMLLDLSPRGLSFRVDPDVGDQFLECKSVEVAFTLPETTEELSFWIQILSCVPGVEGFYCGALFDAERTKDFEAKQQRLVLALQGDFSADFRLSDKNTGSVTRDYIRVWTEN